MLVKTYQDRLTYIDFIYHFSRGFVSLGGVLVPALLSIQSPTSGNQSSLYWTTWSLSLSVTILHNFTSIFRFDKKYYGLHKTIEQLITEGWQYIELSGRYSGHHGHQTPTHENQYVYFVNSVERIRLQQVDEEYNASQAEEKVPSNVQQTKQQAQTDMTIPSPMDPAQNRATK
jgi:hypothetical protein